MKFFDIILQNKKISLKQYLKFYHYYKRKRQCNKKFTIIIKQFPLFDEKKYIMTKDKDDDFYTQECIRFLINWQNNNTINEKLLREDKAGNIYCPLHENPQTSKSPSGKLLVKRNQYICFSSNCSILPNARNNKIISTKQLYFKILQKKEWENYYY